MMRVPILRLGRILLTSIIADLTDEQAMELQTDILGFIRDDRADGVVIDISGVDVVDSYMARLLNETARMVRLLGADAVLSGMQPFVALTLVEMGREVLEIPTALDLESAVGMLKRLMEVRQDGEITESPRTAV